MLGQRRRRCANIRPALCQRPVIVGYLFITYSWPATSLRSRFITSVQHWINTGPKFRALAKCFQKCCFLLWTDGCFFELHLMWHLSFVVSPHQTQNICIIFIECWSNVEDIGPTLYKCYAMFCACEYMLWQYLQPLYMFNSFGVMIDFRRQNLTSRQIMTSNVGLRTARVIITKLLLLHHRVIKTHSPC